MKCLTHPKQKPNNPLPNQPEESMSHHPVSTPFIRRSITSLAEHKNATPMVMLTAYTAPMARILDEHCDVLLVGDSLGMVVYGFDSTLPVMLDMMIAHGAAVVRASARAAVIVDMPFGSYQKSPEQAFENAARVMAETGAQGVKLEGGAEMAETISFLTKRGVPVMGHVGLLPQYVHALGGYKAQGKAADAAARIVADAKAVADAGAFALVIEGVVESVAATITKQVAIPTIGIGASASCDGQVLVVDDMLGLTARTAKFVNRFAELGTRIDETARMYATAVRTRQFPGAENTYKG